jgi:hypothetical protein
MTEMREKIDGLVTFARQREAATRLPDCIPGAEQRLQQAKSELLALIEPVMEENERLRAALRPFGFAANLFTSGVHNGGFENVQSFPNAQEWRVAGGFFPEAGGAVRKSSAELRAALSPKSEKQEKS